MRMDAAATVGRVAAEVPAAASVLQAPHVDCCCGGKRPLLQALGEVNISLAIFAAQVVAHAALRAQATDDTNFAHMQRPV